MTLAALCQNNRRAARIGKTMITHFGILANLSKPVGSHKNGNHLTTTGLLSKFFGNKKTKKFLFFHAKFLPIRNHIHKTSGGSNRLFFRRI
jgi:hypothetical protein